MLTTGTRCGAAGRPSRRAADRQAGGHCARRSRTAQKRWHDRSVRQKLIQVEMRRQKSPYCNGSSRCTSFSPDTGPRGSGNYHSWAHLVRYIMVHCSALTKCSDCVSCILHSHVPLRDPMLPMGCPRHPDPQCYQDLVPALWTRQSVRWQWDSSYAAAAAVHYTRFRLTHHTRLQHSVCIDAVR